VIGERMIMDHKGGVG